MLRVEHFEQLEPVLQGLHEQEDLHYGKNYESLSEAFYVSFVCVFVKTLQLAGLLAFTGLLFLPRVFEFSVFFLKEGQGHEVTQEKY